MSGNQSRSHRLCSQPLKNKITKNKVITTRDLCPFEPTRMLTKFHHSYSQPSSSSSPPRPCRINNTLHSAATCVQWAGYETQKRERKPCSSQRGKQITRLEQQPNVKSDMRMSNCVLESQPQSKCFRRRCPHRYNEEASRTGGFFLGIIPANENSQLPRVRAETKHDFTFSKNGCCGRARTAEPGNAGRRALGGGDGQKTHWRSQRTNSDCTGRHLYVYS